MQFTIRQFLILSLAGLFAVPVLAGPIRDALMERAEKRRATAEQTSDLDGTEAAEAPGAKGKYSLPSGARTESNLAYGPDPAQRLDVHIPKNAEAAPIIVMVHGGAWMIGDKGYSAVVTNKAARWLPKGYVLVSVNYRMSKSPNPADQADDVGRALAFVQAKAASWGGDPNRLLLMGHSAGAHLVALVTADARIATSQGAKNWLGTVALDSAALNVVQIMESEHPRFYDTVFGKDPAHWAATSPFQRMQSAPVPMLLVCSSQRADSCATARAFAAKATSLGGRVSVLPVDLKHGAVNSELGKPNDYTTAVEAFMRSLGLP